MYLTFWLWHFILIYNVYDFSFNSLCKRVAVWQPFFFLLNEHTTTTTTAGSWFNQAGNLTVYLRWASEFHLPCRGIYQIRRGICQILPRKTVGPNNIQYLQLLEKLTQHYMFCHRLVLEAHRTVVLFNNTYVEPCDIVIVTWISDGFKVWQDKHSTQLPSINHVECGGSVVDSAPCVRKVAGSIPTLAAT